jgi:hypothetical protein
MDVAWGWTVSDLERMAGHVARDHNAHVPLHQERRDIAYHHLVVAVLDAAARPAADDLFAVARNAISAAGRSECRARGLSGRDSSREAERFARYWHSAPRLASPYEDGVIDRLALAQIWAVLLPSHRRVLEALAEHGTYGAAAEALGTTDATFRVRVSKARAAFRGWWHEHERPSRMRGDDRRVTPARTRPVTRLVRTRARDRARTQEAA